MSTNEGGVPQQSSSDPNTSGSGTPGAPTPQPELPSWATKAKTATPFSEARMAAYIGPRWETSYRAKLTPFFADPRFNVSWNWAAFFVGPLWFLYRKLYMAFIVFFCAGWALSTYLFVGVESKAVSTEVLLEANRPILITVIGLRFAMNFAAAGTANWWLFRRARLQSLFVTLQQLPEDVAIARLRRAGGVNALPIVLIILLEFAFSFAAVMANA